MNCWLIRLATPASRFKHAISIGRRPTLGADRGMAVFRVRLIASALYFGAAALAVAIILLLVAVDSALGVSFL